MKNPLRSGLVLVVHDVTVPIEYRFYKDIGLLHTAIKGGVAVQDVTTFFDRIENLDRGSALVRELTDFSKLTHLDISDDQVDGLIALIGGMYARNDMSPRIACYAPRAPGREIAQRFMAGVLALTPKLRAERFDTANDALRFLQVPWRDWSRLDLDPEDFMSPRHP